MKSLLKKCCFGVVAAMLAVMVMILTVQASGEIMYICKETARAYEERSLDSDVEAVFYGGMQVLIADYSDNWYGVLIEDPDGDGQELVWIPADDLSPEMPQSLCPHSFGDWQVIQEPTCMAVKVEMRYCAICGIAEERDGGLGDHQFGEWTVTKQPTCTAEGEREHTCTLCGTTQKEIMPKADHQYGEWTVTKQATCTEEGEREHTCRVCQYKEKQKVEKLPHDFEWTIMTEPTDNSQGMRQRVCKVCGYAEAGEGFDPEGTIRRGARGEEVSRMQQLLADQGYLDENEADGIFGGKTEQALMAFQTDHGFTPDGVGWPQTLKKLNHDFGPWKSVEKLTRDSAGERVRTCKDCGFEQREIIEPAPALENGQRGEDVRIVQEMLNALGYDAGYADGIYGKKLDAAYAELAEDHETEFEPGRLDPAHIDLLVNAWLESVSGEEEIMESTADDPVSLSLTVTPVEEEAGDEPDDLMTFNWSAVNQGTETCHLQFLLLRFGEEEELPAGYLVMAVDGTQLQANGENAAEGTFYVSREWGTEPLHFSALAISDQTAQKWLSNTCTI